MAGKSEVLRFRDEEIQRLFVEPSEVSEFQDINASLAILALRDERLGFIQSQGHLDLRQTGSLSGLT